MLSVLDLFSGIGGFSLGLERTGGFRTVAFCEIDAYCRAVLRKHWPAVPIFEDVRDLHAFDVGPVDVICGGFPCQDISVSGPGGGLAGTRSGLWSEYRRLIEGCRPSWVIVENVSALRARGLDQVLGEIAALGYDAEWHCIPASAVGAPHQRDRIWIVAYAQPAERWPQHPEERQVERESSIPTERQEAASRAGVRGSDVADAHGPRLQIGELLARVRGETECRDARQDAALDGQDVADADGLRELQPQGREPEERRRFGYSGGWGTEPDVGRVAHGVPSRVDRLRALGNAVVPQIPEIIGRAILEAERISTE